MDETQLVQVFLHSDEYKVLVRDIYYSDKKFIGCALGQLYIKGIIQGDDNYYYLVNPVEALLLYG
jgi:hypothetical protein